MHGATAHAIGAALYEDFVYDEDGQLLTLELLRLPRAARAGRAGAEDRRDRVPFAVLAARGEGHGRGRRRRHPLHRLGDSGRPQAWPASRSSTRSRNPSHRVWAMLQDPEKTRANVDGACRHEGRGDEGALGLARRRLGRLSNDPAQMAKLMPGVEGFEVQDERHWQAKVKIPLGLGGLRMTIDFDKVEERPPEFAQLNAKGNGVGAIMNMQTQFHLSEAGTRHVDALGGRRQDRRPGRRDGPARAAADHQPAGRERPAPRSRSRSASRRGHRRAEHDTEDKT